MRALVARLRGRGDVDPDRIYVLGHSEGAITCDSIASVDPWHRSFAAHDPLATARSVLLLGAGTVSHADITGTPPPAQAGIRSGGTTMTTAREPQPYMLRNDVISTEKVARLVSVNEDGHRFQAASCAWTFRPVTPDRWTARVGPVTTYTMDRMARPYAGAIASCAT